jgi:hypothetical protein
MPTSYYHHTQSLEREGEHANLDLTLECLIRHDWDPGYWRDANGDGCPPSHDYEIVRVEAAYIDVTGDTQEHGFTLRHEPSIVDYLNLWGIDVHNIDLYTELDQTG